MVMIMITRRGYETEDMYAVDIPRAWIVAVTAKCTQAKKPQKLSNTLYGEKGVYQ